MRDPLALWWGIRVGAYELSMTAMDWLVKPSDYRHHLNIAAAIENPGQRLTRLAALAGFRLSFMETIQLDKALQKIEAKEVAGFLQVRLAVLAASTVDHLLPAIRVAGLRRGLRFELYAASYGQYRQELLDPTSPLHRFNPDIVLLSLTAREVITRVPVTATKDEVERALADVLTDLQGLWRAVRENFGATVIQQSFLDVFESVFGNYDRVVPAAPSRVVGRLNDLLADAVLEHQVLLFDMAQASARDGIDAWFDKTRWLQGKLEIAPLSAPLYGELFSRIVAAQRGLSKKCLVLDLDNTLWGGVIGDDGLEGIVLGEGSAVGEAHLDLQRYAKVLEQRGIILAVCSKNDARTAESVFHDHPEMLLKRQDISAFVANWTDKAENLRSIAKQLNIGLDSLVFVDDNPVERARVRECLPAVAVPELPEDPVHYVRCIADAGYFEATGFTAEDRGRGEQYAANVERETMRGSSQNMDDFLRGLEMLVTFGPITPIDLTRVTQLINKTNQFNTTTRRYTSQELTEFAADPENITLQFRLDDRFGCNGLVSIMILCRDHDEPDVFEIISWVMSCRVFGRQLEDEAMNIVVETAQSRSVRALRAEYIPTAKNTVISGLYERLGFAPMQTPVADNSSRWLLNLADYSSRPTFFTRKADPA